MKVVEVSTKGVPQLYILLALIIYSTITDGCIRLIDTSVPMEIAFFALSVLQTYVTIILSTISSINIKKGGQLSLSSKITLALSISFQLAAQLTIMILIPYMAVSSSINRITTTSAVLLLVLPILIGWALNLLLHTELNTAFHLLSMKDKIIHLLSDTWFTHPVRRMGERDQRHKGREMFFGLLLAGINLMGTFVAVIVSSQEEPLTMTNSDYILIIDIRIPLNLLVIILHLMGCGFLLLFEKTIHPWRHLGKERESHCWGKLQGTQKGIVAELTVWNQVRTNSLL